MIVYVKTHELSPGITAMTFTGRLIRGNKWNDIEYVIRERVQQGLRNLVLDFSGLSYIDSAGIGFIAVCLGLMEKSGGRIAIAAATGHVKELLELTHLDHVAPIYPDLASAHSALSWTATPPQG
jgi:anti-sigma B factor antagonist